MLFLYRVVACPPSSPPPPQLTTVVAQALAELRQFTSPFHNYGAYRKVQEGTRDFCIPYMYVHNTPACTRPPQRTSHPHAYSPRAHLCAQQSQLVILAAAGCICGT